jgi:hypothetical protein
MPCMLAKMIKKVFDAKYFKQSTQIDFKKTTKCQSRKGFDEHVFLVGLYELSLENLPCWPIKFIH